MVSSHAEEGSNRAEDLIALKVDRTPTFFVNGKPLPVFGAQQLVDLVSSEVQAAKSKK